MSISINYSNKPSIPLYYIHPKLIRLANDPSLSHGDTKKKQTQNRKGKKEREKEIKKPQAHSYRHRALEGKLNLCGSFVRFDEKNRKNKK